jgi:hypothetical protein
MVARARPNADSARPAAVRPPARAASEARNRLAAPAWQTACTRPTRCWSWCSADQSARPVAAAGAVPATPAAISTPAARSVPGNMSSKTAEVQQPSGSRTSAGCAGWPNGTPCRASVRGPAGSARTTVSDRLWMTGSRACARSMRSASAAGRDSSEPLRALRVRRVGGRRDCRTISPYPPSAPPTRRNPPAARLRPAAWPAARGRSPRTAAESRAAAAVPRPSSWPRWPATP